MAILGLFSIFILIAFWIYLFVYSHRHKGSSISPWGYSIVIVGILVSGRGIPLSYNQAVVFSMDISLVVSLIGMLWNISNIGNLFYFRNKGEIFRYLGIGLLSGLLLGSYFITPQGIKYVQVGSQYTSFALIAITIQVSIAEEILFRGYFLSYLRKSEFNQIFAIVFQALIFTFIHVQYMGDWMAILDVFLVGAIAGYLTWKSNNLFPAFILHIVANIMAIIWWLNVH